jgi:RNA polymerase sigma-32 factor
LFNLRSMRQTGYMSGGSALIAAKLAVKPEKWWKWQPAERRDWHWTAIRRMKTESVWPHHLPGVGDYEPTRVLEKREREHQQNEAQVRPGSWTPAAGNCGIRWVAGRRPATLHDLAARFGFSAERIRQIEAKDLQIMLAP